MAATIRTFTQRRPTTPAPLLPLDGFRCYECSAYVPPFQRRRTMRRYQAVICRDCEPWVRRTLRYRTIEGGK